MGLMEPQDRTSLANIELAIMSLVAATLAGKQTLNDPDTQTITASQGRTSSTPGDLASVGPTVTVTVGQSGRVLVAMYAEILNSTTDYSIGYLTVSGANTIAASQKLINQGLNQVGVGDTFLLKGLNPGITTFKMQYSNFNNTSTASFANRQLTVIPQ